MCGAPISSNKRAKDSAIQERWVTISACAHGTGRQRSRHVASYNSEPTLGMARAPSSAANGNMVVPMLMAVANSYDLRFRDLAANATAVANMLLHHDIALYAAVRLTDRRRDRRTKGFSTVI
jgi:hypothetical protein